MATADMIPKRFTSSITKVQSWSRKAMADLWASKSTLLGKEEVDRLDRLYKSRRVSSVTGTQSQEIEYKTSSKSEAGRKGYGRLYGYKGFSLEQLNSELRATLCCEIYHDIDCVNCQPTLLQQIAARHDKELPCLLHYIAHRNEFLSALQEDLNCSRSEAKTRVLAVLYGGASSHPVLRTLSAEIRTFANFLATTDEWSELFSLTPSENRLASFLALVLQNEERRCLIAMNEWMEGHGWKVDVLAYDGFMVRRREDHPITGELLEELSAAVESATGYRIELAEKPMIGLELPAPEASTQEVVQGVTMAAYTEMKARFEETHFYLLGACKVCWYDESTNTIIHLTREQAVESLIEWNFPSASGKFVDNTLFVPLWMRDPTRRTVKRIEMGAPVDDPSVFVVPYKPAWEAGACSDVDPARTVAMFVGFVEQLIPDEELRNTILDWMAHMVQKPFENSKTCVVLAGGKGCGKDTLGDFIGNHLLGELYSQNYDSTKQFWSEYDVGRFCKVFVKLEEAQGYLNREHESEFKSRITADILMFNPKQKTPFSAPNYCRIFVSTNEATAVKVDDGERRFVIAHCGSSLIGNMDYWRELRATLFNPGGAHAVGSWLMTRSIAAFPRLLPKSELHKEIIDAERSTEERFAIESEDWDKEEMTATELFAAYRAWCSANGITPTSHSQWFGRNLSQVVLNGKLRRRMLGGKSLYSRLSAPVAGAGTAQ